ncbi:MAG: hypothetical protein AAFR35_14595 [Pseudomonadota bacterium]
MSERFTQQDVEDVLSSVRRLVAGRAERVARPKAGEASQSEADEKLLLTPSLRIAEAEASAGETDGASIDPEENGAGAEGEAYPAFSHSEATDTDAFDTQGAEAEPYEGEPNTADPDGDASTEGEEPRSFWTAPPPPEPDAPLPPVDRSNVWSLEDRIAELEAAVEGRSAETFEPDGSESSEADGPQTHPMAQGSEEAAPDISSETAQEIAPEQAPEDETAADEDAPREDQMLAASPDYEPIDPALNATVAVMSDVSLERLFQRFEDEESSREEQYRNPPDPDEASPLYPAEAAPEPEDLPLQNDPAIDADPTAELAEKTMPEPQSSLAAPIDDAPVDLGDLEPDTEDDEIEDDDLPDLLTDVGVDEDMLREMVAEIVREELQGVLGERITRNVRKLVRREIHRALLTRDFR